MKKENILWQGGAILGHPTGTKGFPWRTEGTLATRSTAPLAKLLPFGPQLPPVSSEYLVK